jgi:hypothetical protein
VLLGPGDSYEAINILPESKAGSWFTPLTYIQSLLIPGASIHGYAVLFPAVMGFRGLLDDITVFIAAYAQVRLRCLLVRQRHSTCHHVIVLCYRDPHAMLGQNSGDTWISFGSMGVS